MSSFSTSAVSEAGKAVALAVVLTIVAAYVPLIALFVIPALPLPIGFVTLRRGVKVGVAATACAAVLAGVVTGPTNGLMALLLAGALGVVLGVALRARRGFSATLLITGAGASVALVIWSGLVWVLTGMSVDKVLKLIDESFAAASKAYSTMGMSQASIDAASQQVRQAVDMIPYVAPSIVAVAGVMLASVSLALAAAVYPHVGERSVGELAFSRFRLHWGTAYGYIAGLALSLLASRFGAHEDTVRLVGLNLLVFFQTLFFLQGLALVHWFAVSRQMSSGGRMVLYAAAVLGQVMLQLTSWAGLLDTWFDYRKRYPPQGVGQGPVTPAGPRMNDHEES